MNEEEAFSAQMDAEQHKNNMAFLAGAPIKDNTGMWDKHLDAKDLLESIEKLLMGYEYDNETEEYRQVTLMIQDSVTGQSKEVIQGPILDPVQIRMTTGYLKTFLNSNVYLSTYKDEEINNLMWDVKKKLTVLLHPLKNRFDSKTVDVIGSMIENPIYSALKRATDKTTLNAFTRSSHSIEHINPNAKGQQADSSSQKKPFKLFGL